MTIREAHGEDLAGIMAVLDAARGIMRSDGNTGQWVNGYPSEEVILNDIENGHGFVVTADKTIGYFAFIPSPEPTYNYIEGGSWLNDEPYHVVHRIGSYPEVHGVFNLSGDSRLAYQKLSI